MNPLNFFLFSIGSIGIIFVSWRSLKTPRFHGFYRFFAFESCLAVVIINLKGWFANPFSPFQIISWIMLMASIVCVANGVMLLVREGKPDNRETSAPEMGFEKTTRLVTMGIYRYIRHPMYASLLFLAWGAFFKHLSWEGIIFSLLATIFLSLTARLEEIENQVKFGEDYSEYMRKTKKFIPFVY
jgi:protein-S-isoprenylcysteine O-methyltransferase Ste14